MRTRFSKISKIFFLLLVFILVFSVVGAAASYSRGRSLPFNDVNNHDWFFDSVVWVYDNGIMNGINETTFDPNGDMTRGMLVTVLWRYADRPIPNAGITTFQDVMHGRWYSDAVAWANENGIVMGHSATFFGVNELVTREQMYTILYRYMNFAELTIVLDNEMQLQQFFDEDDISNWALDAMYFMYDAGVMFRHSSLDMSARPQETAFRAEIAGAMFFFDKYAVPHSITDGD